MDKIKCFIISFNRLTFLKAQVEFLSKFPELEIIIVDNHSTYPPLLEYLHELEGYGTGTSGVQVIHVPTNRGHRVVWDLHLSKDLASDVPYLVTDCDVIPERHDFLDLLKSGLELFQNANKVGLGLRINDIPHGVPFRSEIIGHENNLLRHNTQDVRYARMAVDTTMAIYRAGYHYPSVWGYESDSNEYRVLEGVKSIRTTYPWTARHMSWYLTIEDIKTDENQFYLNSLTTSTHWSQRQRQYLEK